MALVGQLCELFWDWVVNRDRRCEWDRCVLRFKIWLWIETDGDNRTDVWWCFLLGRERRRPCVCVGNLCGEVWYWVVKTAWQSEWETVGWSLWLGYEDRMTEWLGQMWGVVCDWAVNKYCRRDWVCCGLMFEVGLWIQTDGVSGHLLGEFCDWTVNTSWGFVWDNCWLLRLAN
jgi:hypothetical protein